jgi:predicted DNA-binding ribbon-helix-helix protein
LAIASLGFENGFPGPTSRTAAAAGWDHDTAATVSQMQALIIHSPSRRPRRAHYHGPGTAESPTLTGLIKRSFSLAGHRTSVALEAPFWDVLNDVARIRGISLSRLVAEVDAARDGSVPLASSLRVLALRDALAQQRNEPD